MKKITLVFLIFLVVLACNSDTDSEININEQNFLVFGHFFGECFGEGCIETFKLTDDSLFEDTIDDYNGQNMEFIALENETFEQVKDLATFFPNQLLNQNETVFGCPDCADGGGLFIQYSENGTVTSWRIDLNKASVPNYLHDFMDKVNEKIALINN